MTTTTETTIAIESTPPAILLPNAPPFDASLKLKLEAFCLQHASLNRPIVLVSSGGTVADLEARTVRSLENFSTGLRGALSVEQFLERGYAVVHLWRTGSTSPFGRVVAQSLGLQGNHGISAAALNRLLEHDHNDDDDDDDEEGMVATVKEDDPWLTDDITTKKASTSSSPADKDGVSLQLHHRLSNDEHLQRASRQWRAAKSRLLTIPFRSVEEYLVRLKDCALILDDSKSLCMFYLAAAVSDFYVPDKVEHKIQSAANPTELVITLKAVPKIMGLLRTEWAPDAFVVSFKLETDSAILRRKSERAVTSYGVHMVVGNILDTRYDVVHVLHGDNNTTTDEAVVVQDWTMKEVHKSPSSPFLEVELIEFIVQQHFTYISQNFNTEHAALKTHERLVQRKKELQKQVYWKNLQDGALQVGGTIMGMAITYVVSMAMQRRMK
jgi:phosphopantothenate-cysteine ligase